MATTKEFMQKQVLEAWNNYDNTRISSEEMHKLSGDEIQLFIGDFRDDPSYFTRNLANNPAAMAKFINKYKEIDKVMAWLYYHSLYYNYTHILEPFRYAV